MGFYGNAAIRLMPPFSVVAILINGSSSFGSVLLPAMNAGDVVGALTTITSPPGHTQNTPLTLGGPDAASFAITNGGIIPCNLIVGVSNILGGSYQISLTAS